ncbi:uncharacterized protein Tco025E_00088 [Trypanosoma conorhini]|uniref:Uncharacterized protein n=1 Tax=Trypanosoma conorhini TaxID=83891 RepID=A0A3R7M6W1_9TRYP|nr:uncharacterized protein Tco025E_00088 [Trypanosoma conorhini]RNF27704.1 hypothetical protein Tco025E_00088 [Trypanosoma conorhini]
MLLFFLCVRVCVGGRGGVGPLRLLSMHFCARTNMSAYTSSFFFIRVFVCLFCRLRLLLLPRVKSPPPAPTTTTTPPSAPPSAHTRGAVPAEGPVYFAAPSPQLRPPPHDRLAC